MTLLRVENIHIAFGDSMVAKNISFTLDKGETLALVGESGSGKSVTALSILQLLPKTAHVAGCITFDGHELLSAPPGHIQTVRGRRIAMIFQEPMTALNPLHTVEKQVAEMFALHKGMDADTARPHVLHLLRRVGIDNAEQRLRAYPHELSGGQRQRVMIAMALAADPDILIADEPTTALDVTIQQQILELLRDLQRERNMALLLITHDLHIVRKIADRVLVMHHGEIVETAPAATLFTAPQHDYTKMLLAAEPSGTPHPVAANASLVVEAKHVRVHYPIKAGLLRHTVDVVKAVDDISFTLRAGETLGIVGESGSGKSSLVQALLRLIPFDGSVTLNGERFDQLQGAALRGARRHVQMVFQDPFASLSPRLTVGDIVLEGPRNFNGRFEPKVPEFELQRRLNIALETVGLTPDMAHRYPHEFSGGQRQRIAIARALILRPKLLVLDEPTSALDRSVQKQALDLLRDLQKQMGMAYLFITHDLAVVKAMAHRVIVMKQGMVVESGITAEVLANPRSDYTRALLAAAFD